MVRRLALIAALILVAAGCDRSNRPPTPAPNSSGASSAGTSQTAAPPAAQADPLGGVAPTPAARTDAQDSNDDPNSPAPSTGTLPTHVIAFEWPYYTSGPQQGRPPDGRFAAGTKVRRLALGIGEHARVRSTAGVEAYVNAGVLVPIKLAEEIPDLAELVRGNNRFAADLYARLRSEQGNVFFSPASISIALAMTYAGADGATAQQMAQVLHFDLPPDRLHAAFATLLAELHGTREANGYELRVANRLWAQKDYPFLPQFLATTRDDYLAEAALVDFAAAGEAARREINAWIEQQTAGKIDELIPGGVLTSLTRLVLTNAVYFKGDWAKQFDKAKTRSAEFHLAGGGTVDVPTMHQTASLPYAEFETHQVLELAYAGTDVSMLIILPRETAGLKALEDKLSGETLAAWTQPMPDRRVAVHLPRFKLQSQFGLADVLAEMGMPQPFDAADADFSGMTGKPDLYVTHVLHKALVDVNEEGSEAAAATAVVLSERSVADAPVEFRADRPFLFLLRHNRTGAVMFMGRVTNPAE